MCRVLSNINITHIRTLESGGERSSKINKHGRIKGHHCEVQVTDGLCVNFIFMFGSIGMLTNELFDGSRE
jgi:hypothetical protein